MPTPNFNLPLIDGTSPISIVNDMNSLATAADSAMATLATAGDISTVRQVATNAATTANQANTAAEEAAAAAKTANDTAVTAQSNATQAIASANQAQASAASANASVDAIVNSDYVEYDLGTAAIPSANGKGSFRATLFYNAKLKTATIVVALSSSSYSVNSGSEFDITFSNALPANCQPVSPDSYRVPLFAQAAGISMELGFETDGVHLYIFTSASSGVTGWGFARHGAAIGIK